MKSRLVVVDTETGGFDPRQHALLSIAAVDFEMDATFTRLIDPHDDWLLSAEALEKNGLTRDFLKKNGVPEREAVQDFALWLGERRGAILAGCNVAFDRDFLRAAFERHGITWPMGKAVDLQAAAWVAWESGVLDLPLGKDKQPRLSLDHIAEALGMSRTSRVHNALEDALLTLSCLHRVLKLTTPTPQ